MQIHATFVRPKNGHHCSRWWCDGTLNGDVKQLMLNPHLFREPSKCPWRKYLCSTRSRQCTWQTVAGSRQLGLDLKMISLDLSQFCHNWSKEQSTWYHMDSAKSLLIWFVQKCKQGSALTNERYFLRYYFYSLLLIFSLSRYNKLTIVTYDLLNLPDGSFAMASFCVNCPENANFKNHGKLYATFFFIYSRATYLVLNCSYQPDKS